MISATPAKKPTAHSPRVSRSRSRPDLIKRGQGRYMIYCYPCHGALGDGNGITKSYGMLVTPSYHDDRIRNMPEGEISTRSPTARTR